MSDIRRHIHATYKANLWHSLFIHCCTDGCRVANQWSLSSYCHHQSPVMLGDRHWQCHLAFQLQSHVGVYCWYDHGHISHTLRWRGNPRFHHSLIWWIHHLPLVLCCYYRLLRMRDMGQILKMQPHKWMVDGWKKQSRLLEKATLTLKCQALP